MASRSPATRFPEEACLIDVSVNGKSHRADVEPDTPLLWVIRDATGLPGTKFDYDMALCGACTVPVQCFSR